MLCYRDRRYCIAACSVGACDRKITDEVLRKAQAWWAVIAGPEDDLAQPSFDMADMSSDCPDYTPVAA